MRGLSDTDPKVARMQIELLRQAGASRCMRMGLNLSEEVIRASRQAFIRRYDDEHTAMLEWIRMFYGEELARGFARATQRSH